MAARGAGNIAFHRAHQIDLQAAGKKDDDGRLRHDATSGAATPWIGAKVRVRSRRRTLLVSVGAVLLIWLLMRSIPDDFWEPNETGARRMAEVHSRTGHPGARPVGYIGSGGSAGSGSRIAGGDGGGGGGGRQGKDADESRPPPRPNNKKPQEDLQYYDGEILFPRLPATLHTIQRTSGYRKLNRNVLFAASNLKSLSNLLPLACAMTKRDLTYVHVAIFGRSHLTIQDVVHINGIDEKECKLYWHDARPNWAAYSSDFRAEASVASALEHIQELMHPQVVFMDDSSLEDQWFTRQVRTKAAKNDWAVIEMPAVSSEKLHWLARLDAPALKAFHRTSVDILVQAPTGRAGGLLRVLKSLSAAHYHGLPIPKLTIELPADVEPRVSEFVSHYRWPPSASPFQPLLSSQLNVRHRIPRHYLTAQEASIRFLESFYPSDDKHSHVLILNDNVEVSPLFYHWLMYYILHYKHSSTGSPFSDQLVGISLETPKTFLNGTVDFEPPSAELLNPSIWPARTLPREHDTLPPFLWQAPNTNAALFFGDKWAELHNYLSQRMRAGRERKEKPTKVIGRHLPAWTEYVLELMRARGWMMLYLASSPQLKPAAVVHGDLLTVPEEYTTEEGQHEAQEDFDGAPPSGDPNVPLKGLESHWNQPEQVLSQEHQPLHAALPFQGEELPLALMPHLLHDGSLVSNIEIGSASSKFAQDFRTTIGGCNPDPDQQTVQDNGKADDLFCWHRKSNEQG